MGGARFPIHLWGSLDLVSYHRSEEEPAPVTYSSRGHRAPVISFKRHRAIWVIPIHGLGWCVQRNHVNSCEFPSNHHESDRLFCSFVCGAQWLNPQGIPIRGNVFPVENTLPSVKEPANKLTNSSGLSTAHAICISSAPAASAHGSISANRLGKVEHGRRWGLLSLSAIYKSSNSKSTHANMQRA